MASNLTLVTLESAPDFPRQDLSENNAEILELLLANNELVTATHVSVEETSWLFQRSHPSLRFAANRLIEETQRSTAFDHGVTAFETITALVESSPGPLDIHATINNSRAITHGLTEDELSAYLDHAHQHFVSDMPRTAKVVLDSSKRFFPITANYAVAGAALARQFEIDSLE